ncbi:MAG: glycosyltransferase [Chloroflexi bacterium]|nr:glycosyltransferase [Chloroflexota bacterium]
MILQDGSILTLSQSEAAQEAGGFVWRKVKSITGQEGWVAEDFISIGAPVNSSGAQASRLHVAKNIASLEAPVNNSGAQASRLHKANETFALQFSKEQSVIIGIDASRAVTAQRTGTEAYAYFLIHALILLAAPRNHTLRLYFNQPPPPGLFPDSPQVETAVLTQRRLWTHLRLARELHRNPPDVFFTPAHVIPYTYSNPSVATIHDLGYHHFPEAHPRRQLAYLRWSTRHNGRSATRLIADSQATKTDLRATRPYPRRQDRCGLPRH